MKKAGIIILLSLTLLGTLILNKTSSSYFFSLSLSSLHSLQDSLHSLHTLFQISAYLGKFQIYITLLSFFYFFLSRHTTFLFLTYISIPMTFSPLFKSIYADSRPYIANTQIHSYSCSKGYGNPSGHAFSAINNYFALFYIACVYWNSLIQLREERSKEEMWA